MAAPGQVSSYRGPMRSATPAPAPDGAGRSRRKDGGPTSGGHGARPSVPRLATDLRRSTRRFEVVSDFAPSGDQPAAIAEMTRRLEEGRPDVVLLGATGTGKSATTAWLVEQVQRPTLVMAPNKTLAAQLANEFRELLPHNAVEYFVSYYDYYQPEAYVPSSDTYIEKDSSINEEVERLRHSATMSLLTRRDVIVVASVSCIYGLGTPQEYVDRMVRLRVGESIERDALLRRFVDVQYTRNDLAFTRGTFRVRGDTVEVFPVYEELAVRIEMFGDEIERVMTLHPLTGEVVEEHEEVFVFPATHYVAGPERMERATKGIELELADRLHVMEQQGKLLEAQRLRMRTTYDLEMMRQVGFCNGIENYSMHIDGRSPGTAPHTLLDYFPDDFLLVLDESHVTVPQIGAMYEGDRSRKSTLVDHGFRLPSAMDNRPLKWEEFLERTGQTVYLSATPGDYEMSRVRNDVVEQVIRPTGLVDPEIVVKPTKGQIDDLVHEIRERAERDERVLVTTLTKKMSEDLTDYLLELGIRVRYLHSEVDTIRRIELLKELRMGDYDVLVGINLLREGLDLPEVSLVSILDADKEGFLRSGRSLIQTIGRAARNVSGQVHMYADSITPSMAKAIDETSRRREKQIAYNLERGVDPQPLRKRVADILDDIVREGAEGELVGGTGRNQSRGKAPVPGMGSKGGDVGRHARELAGMPRAELAQLIQQLQDQMHEAARELSFELAARLRDEVNELKKELRGMDAAGVT
jgi:excinuclease ABC subunit B